MRKNLILTFLVIPILLFAQPYGHGKVNLAGGSNITVTQDGSTYTISSSVGGASAIFIADGDTFQIDLGTALKSLRLSINGSEKFYADSTGEGFLANDVGINTAASAKLHVKGSGGDILRVRTVGDGNGITVNSAGAVTAGGNVTTGSNLTVGDSLKMGSNKTFVFGNTTMKEFATTTVTSASATAIATIPTETNTAYLMTGYVTAISPSGDSTGAYKRTSLIENDGGTVTITSPGGADNFTAEDIAGWDAQWAVSGSDAVLQATGQNSVTIRFKAAVFYQRLTAF